MRSFKQLVAALIFVLCISAGPASADEAKGAANSTPQSEASGPAPLATSPGIYSLDDLVNKATQRAKNGEQPARDPSIRLYKTPPSPKLLADLQKQYERCWPPKAAKLKPLDAVVVVRLYLKANGELRRKPILVYDGDPSTIKVKSPLGKKIITALDTAASCAPYKMPAGFLDFGDSFDLRFDPNGMLNQ